MPFAFPTRRVHGGQHRADTARGQGLGKDEVGAFAESLPQALNVIGSAEHHNGGFTVWLGATDLAGQLKSVELRQPHAQKGHIEPLFLCPLPGLLAVLKGYDRMIQGSRERPHEFHTLRLIIDNHDFQRHRLASASGFSLDAVQGRSRYVRIRRRCREGASSLPGGVQSVKARADNKSAIRNLPLPSIKQENSARVSGRFAASKARNENCSGRKNLHRHVPKKLSGDLSPGTAENVTICYSPVFLFSERSWLSQLRPLFLTV